jgi:hypothetical protein
VDPEELQAASYKPPSQSSKLTWIANQRFKRLAACGLQSEAFIY